MIICKNWLKPKRKVVQMGDACAATLVGVQSEPEKGMVKRKRELAKRKRKRKKTKGKGGWKGKMYMQREKG